MKTTTTILYIITALLVLIGTSQPSKEEELLTEHETLLIPVFTVMFVFLLYLLVKFINHDILNTIILVLFISTGYFTIISNIFYLCEFVEYEFEEHIYQKELSDSEFSELKISTENVDRGLKKFSKVKLRLFFLVKKWFRYMRFIMENMTFYKFLVYSSAFMLVISYAITRNQILEEIISISFCFHTLRELVLDSILTGYTHLLILFMYDVIRVFYGEQMDKFIEDIDVPLKLACPKYFHAFDMIGMGDVFIPSLFIVIVRRYGIKKRMESIYWYTLCGYFCAIGFSIYNVWTKDNPQPVLLFICPILGGIPVIYVTIRGRFKDFIHYKRKKFI